MRRYRFHPSAAEEAEAAARYYDDKTIGLGTEFLADLEDCILTAREFPEIGAPYDFTTRKLLLRRFPFILIYTDHETAIEILAVAHERREPGYWRSRVR